MLTRRTALLAALAAGVAAAVAFGATSAFSGSWTPRPLDLEPAPTSQAATHARVVVDGKEWRVRTYRNREGQLCLFQGATGEGEGGTCLDADSLFARGPVVLYYGSGQDAGDLASWDRAWVWGIASDRVARLDLTLSTCAVLVLHTDADGIFQHAFSAAQLHAGVLPAKVVARDAAGNVIFTEPVRLAPDVPVVRTGAC
jgi:hypothetical protein